MIRREKIVALASTRHWTFVETATAVVCGCKPGKITFKDGRSVVATHLAASLPHADQQIILNRLLPFWPAKRGRS